VLPPPAGESGSGEHSPRAPGGPSLFRRIFSCLGRCRFNRSPCCVPPRGGRRHVGCGHRRTVAPQGSQSARSCVCGQPQLSLPTAGTGRSLSGSGPACDSSGGDVNCAASGPADGRRNRDCPRHGCAAHRRLGTGAHRVCRRARCRTECRHRATVVAPASAPSWDRSQGDVRGRGRRH
jgi:hypothetical protein